MFVRITINEKLELCNVCNNYLNVPKIEQTICFSLETPSKFIKDIKFVCKFMEKKARC